jgi:2-polyprenyl-3-methyl-5-hydroxy-6-metoxy-1,4-benzoquinol methylase
MKPVSHRDRASALSDDLADVPCPLCDAEDPALYVYAPSHYGPEKLKVTRCRACGMIFTNPQSASYQTRVKGRGLLDRYFNPSRLEKARLLAGFHLSYLARIAPGRRILDFGCGEGAFVRQAHEEGWDAVGVDLNDGLVRAAREYWGSNTLHSISLEELLEKGWQFDAIYSNQVFEHLARPVEIGRALTTSLAPGGAIYIEVPNANQVGELLRPGKTLDPTSHFNHFTVATLSRLIERIGCAPAYQTGAPGLFRVWRRLGMGPLTIPLARLTRRILPGIGSGVCALGLKRDL